MAFLGNLVHGLGKGLSIMGGVQDFLPNQVLKALHLPEMTSPAGELGSFLQNPKKMPFGRMFGNNMKLGALAAGAYFGAPALAHAFGLGGGAGAGAGAGAASGNPSVALNELNAGLPSGTAAAGGLPSMPRLPNWQYGTTSGYGNMTQGQGGLASLANAVSGGGGGYGSSMYATGAPASNTVGGGLVGPGGNAVGTGATAGTGAANPGKNMNPILKSFMENYMKRFNERPGNQQTYQAPEMPGNRPGRQYFTTLGGA